MHVPLGNSENSLVNSIQNTVTVLVLKEVVSYCAYDSLVGFYTELFSQGSFSLLYISQSVLFCSWDSWEELLFPTKDGHSGCFHFHIITDEIVLNLCCLFLAPTSPGPRGTPDLGCVFVLSLLSPWELYVPSSLLHSLSFFFIFPISFWTWP